MKRALARFAAVVAAQGLLIGIWYAVDSGQAPKVDPPRSNGETPRRTVEMNRQAPDLTMWRRDGSGLRLANALGRPYVLHFWATWCPPCRQELPALLAWATNAGLPVLAVSVDPDWQAVLELLGPNPSEGVVLADGNEVEVAFSVRNLPATFVVDRAGRLRLRLDGPRDWDSSALRAKVLGAAKR